MPWMPINSEELSAAEQQLGIGLPAGYKARLSDPRVVAMLSHPSIGTIWPGLTMQTFVDATLRLRRVAPGFPPDGVLATLPEGRYVRFWRPDPKNPRTLGEFVYSWDTWRHRQARDCTSDRWVQSMIEVLHQADPGFLGQIGYPAPLVTPTPPMFKTRAGDAALTALWALLSLHGEAAVAAVARQRGLWVPCARLAVRGRYLTPCDLGGLPQAADWALKVHPGVFEAEVQVRMSARGAWPVIGALRLLREDAEGRAGELVAQVDVDAAALAIYDRQPFQRRVRIEERDAFADAMLALPERPCVVMAGRTLEILVVPSGEGDGRYPVLELRDGSDTVGLQITFLAPEPDPP
jgi:hypothetical protein